jgi:RNA-directed DNA polymerase
MLQDAPPNGSAGDDVPQGAWSQVAGMQAKLHRWAAADPGRRFDDLFNFVHDPATLIVAFGRVAGNRGANTPGVDGWTVALVEERIGVRGFLDDLRAQLKAGTFQPLPRRERRIPRPGGSGKLRKLGIPAVADKVVQAALKLVLEPIFEAGFEPVSYGFRPMRRAHDAIAEIHVFGTNGYRWVLDADSPVPGNGHAGFGERPGETDPEQSGNRAPGRLNPGKTSAPIRRTGWSSRSPRRAKHISHRQSCNRSVII